ncbi:hypothetical protein SAMN05444064_11336 [Pseudomonas syringae]|nr:hypothetical protein SAMN05444514_11236 [Pseudomonas syringae]SFM29182.1 hypothetical protein SAMN05444064_11336 [Pseudomonas syringae]
MIDNLLYSQGMNSSGLGLESDDVLDLLHDKLSVPDEQQQLQAFSPVLVNVIRRLNALQAS